MLFMNRFGDGRRLIVLDALQVDVDGLGGRGDDDAPLDADPVVGHLDVVLARLQVEHRSRARGRFLEMTSSSFSLTVAPSSGWAPTNTRNITPWIGGPADASGSPAAFASGVFERSSNS